MSLSESQSERVLELAEAFLERYRKGERPQLKEYFDRHPELAAEIKEVFPAMAMMENIAVVDESLPSPVAPGKGDSRGANATPLTERQLGDYRIIREIGHGGMGVVYEAEQVSLGRHVALKVLPNQAMQDSKQKRRFEREARAAAKLHHTNIVPVFGVGEHDGVPYYVMQFIQGLGLDAVLDELNKMQPGVAHTPTGMPTGGEIRVSRRDVSAADVARSLMTGMFHQSTDGDMVVGDGGDAKRHGSSDLTLDNPINRKSEATEVLLSKSVSDRQSESFTVSSSSIVLSGSSGTGRKSAHKKQTYWQSVANIGRQVAEALEYAHKQGVLHRDVKPSNLLLDLRGTVWVTDFGLAKVAGPGAENITHTGDILGTLRYMPPEAFEGTSDARGDVYSLGLTLYELLAKRPAFDEKDRHKLIKQVTSSEPTPLDKVRREVPRDLVTIVQKSIAREPGRRYTTAGDLATDLQRFLDDEPILARRQTPVERYIRWARHNPGIATLSGVLALVLVTATLASMLAAGHFNRLRLNEAESAQRERDARQAESLQRQIAEESEKKAKAYGLVQLVLNLDTPKVPAVIREMAEYRQWTDPMLREVPDRFPQQKLHASLALLPVDPGQVDYLVDRLLEADPQYTLPVILDALAPYQDRLREKLWAMAEAPEQGKVSQRLRVAAALAKYDPDSKRWVKSQATSVFLSTLQEKDVRTLSGGFSKNGTCASSSPTISVDGIQCSHSLFTHPISNSFANVAYDLDQPYMWLVTKVALSPLLEVDPATPLTFEVLGDGRSLWMSKPLAKRGDMQDCVVRLEGVRRFELRVNCPGRDTFAQAFWLEPRLTHDLKTQATITAALLAVPVAQLAGWKEALRPARLQLLAPLASAYRSNDRPAERSLATELLADYAADQPQLLAELLMDADEEQFLVIFPKFRDLGERGLTFLTSVLNKERPSSNVTTDWNVRFYRWGAAEKPTLGVRFFGPTFTSKIAGIIADGPADRAGLKVNDIIRAFGTKVITNQRELNAEIQKRKVGDKVTLKVNRAGESETREVEVIIGAQAVKAGPNSALLRPADWQAVLHSPILDELRARHLRLVCANDRPAPPSPKVPGNYFAAVATTDLMLEDGGCVLIATFDDGIRVWMDDKVIYENWRENAPVTHHIPIRGSRGKHQIKVEFFQSQSGYVLQVGFDVSHLDRAARRQQSNAAEALLRLNQLASVWPLFRHSPDPSLRTHLIHRLAPLGFDSRAIVKQLGSESDTSSRRALLLSLGEFSEKDFTPEDRKALLPNVQDIYRKASDPGLHAAAEWLLRTWKEEAWLKQVNDEWTKDKAQLDLRLNSIEQLVKKDKTPPQWYVNGQGQTMVVIPGQVEFWMGEELEKYWQQIRRNVAVASSEVTVAQFLRFRMSHPVNKGIAVSNDSPVNNVTWYEAAAYCNWLSEEEGIPKDQWCYEPNEKGEYTEGMKVAPNYLERTGYRLPTEAEWEYACRAGAVTRYSFGESEELLPKYAWHRNNAQNRFWPVGSLKPNDLGLFDMHGNAYEWCQEALKPYGNREDARAIQDLEDHTEIAGSSRRILRGGSQWHEPSLARCADRGSEIPGKRDPVYGFRPVRTLPFPAFDRFLAARARALAAAGQGKNQAPLEVTVKAKLGSQALDRLKAELAEWSKSQPPRTFIVRNLWRWQHDSALSGIRDAAALAKLPPMERLAFTQLWDDIAKNVEPTDSHERLEFARIAVLIAAGQGESEPAFDEAAKEKLREQALAWLKAELPVAAERADKARIIAAASPVPDLLDKLAEANPNDGTFLAEIARSYADRGKTSRTNAALTKARTVLETQLANEPDNSALAMELADLLLIDGHWTVLTPSEMKSEGGATLTNLEDHSILVSGRNPTNDVYTLTFRNPPARIQQLRLEVVPHESLPHSGPGRYPDHGGFILTAIKTQLDHPTNKIATRHLKLARASADFSQNVNNVVGALDADDNTGWGIFPELGKRHVAVFELSEPAMETVGTVLRVTLEFKKPGDLYHGLGRFRLSVFPDLASVDQEEKRLAALKITDPWLKLAAAYTLSGRNDKATQYSIKAHQSDPTLGDDRQAQLRYHAARIAVLAATKPGKDEPALDDAARANLRRQALDWLQAELAATNKYFDSGPADDRPTIVARLGDWLKERDLAGVRDSAELARLPKEERKQWQGLWEQVPQVRSVVPTSQEQGQKWRYTTTEPAEGWMKADFDDKDWQEGIGGFGSGTYASRRTEWKTRDIWLRREFTLPEGKWDDLLLMLFNDDGTQVYLNGVLTLTTPNMACQYDILLGEEVRKALKPGRNVLAVHCQNDTGEQYIDAGIVSVSNNAARLALARIARDRRRFALASELWAAVLASDPKLGEDRRLQHRYNAARVAALAAAGLGNNEPQLDDAAKAKLRRKSLEWLKAELTAWSKALEATPPEDRPAIFLALGHWQLDTDLAGVRDAEALAKLPEAEQKEWQALWVQVETLLKQFSSLLATEQVEVVRLGLKARNPGFDGMLTPTIENGDVVGLSFSTDFVTDISPVRALIRLQNLDMQGSAQNKGSLVNLTPLAGLSLKKLTLTFNPVQNLAALKGMPLKALYLMRTKVTDLTPLTGMPLETLMLWGWGGSDLTPLKGMPLKWLNFGGGGKNFDLGQLAGLPLEFLCINHTQVSDLTPLKGFPLRALLSSATQVTNLTPLQGMPLQELYILNCKVSDLTPVKGMPLTHLDISGTSVTDLSLLKEMPLKLLNCNFQLPRDAEILGAIKTLTTLNGEPARPIFARIAYDQKRFVLAARLFEEELASDSKLGDDRQKLYRYNAACCAALAAVGQGQDEPPLDEAAKTKLRGKALDLLKAELTAWDKFFEAEPTEARPLLVKAVGHWQKDTDLASLRDNQELAKLPADETKRFTELWIDVVALLKKAEGKPK